MFFGLYVSTFFHQEFFAFAPSPTPQIIVNLRNLTRCLAIVMNQSVPTMSYQNINRRNFIKTSLAAAGAFALRPAQLLGHTRLEGDHVLVFPEFYERPLRNPLMGFRPGIWGDDPFPAYNHPWGCVAQCYIKWNEIEDHESDGIARIVDFCNRKWRDAENHNVKVAPRVYLHWSRDDQKYWPMDMTPDDYTSPQFHRRCERLIERLGQVWNDDPRIAWVQVGIVGKWGEHHAPFPTEETQQVLGSAYQAAFPDKKVLVRYPWRHFTDFDFGIYWDAWGNWNQMRGPGSYIDQLNEPPRQMWRNSVIEGESAYNCCGYETQPGPDPTTTMKVAHHRDHLIDTLRRFHCSALGWVASYDQDDAEAVAGAEEVQLNFGYRYNLEAVRYPAELTRGQPFEVELSVKNLGSAPMYYNWPVEVSLLDASSQRVAWSDTFDGCDIRDWLPGQNYNSETREYDNPAERTIIQGTFALPEGLRRGEYILAIAVLDPAGMLPSLRFSTVNYFRGGRHPIGRVGVGMRPRNFELSADMFDDPAGDRTLRYVNDRS